MSSVTFETQRTALADVVAISLRSGKIVWRFPVEGVRSDHMAVSPNGRHVVVSASTTAGRTVPRAMAGIA